MLPLELSQAVFTQMSMGPSWVTASPSAWTDAGSVTLTVSGSARAPGMGLGYDVDRLLGLVARDVGHRYGGARLGQPQRRGLAHAAAATGDDRDPAVQGPQLGTGRRSVKSGIMRCPPR